MNKRIGKAFVPLIKRKVRKIPKGYSLQVTIPVEILRHLKDVDNVIINEGDYLRFHVFNKVIRMEKIEPKDVKE